MKTKLITILTLFLAIMLSGCASSADNSVEFSEAFVLTTEEAAGAAENRFLSYDFTNISDPLEYNENPTITNEMPGAYEWIDFNEPQSTEDLLLHTTQIAIIKIKGCHTKDGSLTGDAELDRAVAEKALISDVTKDKVYEATVQAVIEGSLAVDEDVQIFVAQGEWGINFEDGMDYLVMLMEYDGIYKLPLYEDSVYNIADDFTVTSQSSFLAANKFNELSLADSCALLSQTFEKLNAEEQKVGL